MDKKQVIPQDILDDAARIFHLTASQYEEYYKLPGSSDYIKGRMDERTKWLPKDPNFEAITGHKTLGEWKAAEASYEAGQELMIKFINEWDGYTNSTFGEAMMNAVKRVSWTDEEDVSKVAADYSEIYIEYHHKNIVQKAFIAGVSWILEKINKS